MRYEKNASEYENDPQKLQELLIEYEEIRIGLERELTSEEKSGLYTDLLTLIMKITDYIFQGNKKVQKGFGDVIGGKVLELESERLFSEGKAVGMEEGKAEGEELFGRLISVLMRDGKVEEVSLVARDPEARKKYYHIYGLDHNSNR